MDGVATQDVTPWPMTPWCYPEAILLLKYAEIHKEKQGHAARSDPAPFDFFSSISVLIFATLPGFCDFRMLT